MEIMLAEPLTGLHEPISRRTVEAAMKRYQSKSETKSQGQLVVMIGHDPNRNGKPLLGFWGVLGSELIKMRFSEHDQWLCDQWVTALSSGDEIIGQTSTGLPIYGSERYDHSKGYQ